MSVPEVLKFTGDHFTHFTQFEDTKARTKEDRILRARELADIIRTTSARTKAELPLLTLTQFGDRRTISGSLRSASNATGLSEIEVEYDGERLGFDEAAQIFRDHGLSATLYTTPSHTPEKPRWRAILSTLHPLPREDRRKLVARVNGIFGGILASESFNVSQPFFFGYVLGNEASHRVELIEGDFIDQRPDLDATAIQRKSKTSFVDTAKLERQLDREVDWFFVSQCSDLEALKKHFPDLGLRLETDLARPGALAHRWQHGFDGLNNKTRSAADRSLVQILRLRGYSITEAIACAVAWGQDHPYWGRGHDSLDKKTKAEIKWERYWVRCWINEKDLPSVPLANLLRDSSRHGGPEVGKFPERCKAVPGILAPLADYLARASYKVLPRELVVSASLLTIAYAVQNRFMVGSPERPTPIQLYVLIVGQTGGGKTDLSKAISAPFKDSVAMRGFQSEVASGPALLKQLARLAERMPFGPCMVFIPDEFGLFLQARNGRNGPHQKDIIDEIMRLFGVADHVHTGKAYADEKKQIEPIYYPNLQVLGLTTERPLAEGLTEADFEQGFTNRFLLAYLPETELPLKHISEVNKKVPSALSKFLTHLGTSKYSLPPPANIAAALESARTE